MKKPKAKHIIAVRWAAQPDYQYLMQDLKNTADIMNLVVSIPRKHRQRLSTQIDFFRSYMERNAEEMRAITRQYIKDNNLNAEID